MSDDSAASSELSTPQRRWRRHLRRLRREKEALHHDVRLAAIELDLLEHFASIALGHLRELSERETELVRAYPSGAERFQYVIDKAAQVMARVVDDLSQRWQLG